MNRVKKILFVIVTGLVIGNSSVFAAGRHQDDKYSDKNDHKYPVNDDNKYFGDTAEYNEHAIMINQNVAQAGTPNRFIQLIYAAKKAAAEVAAGTVGVVIFVGIRAVHILHQKCQAGSMGMQMADDMNNFRVAAMVAVPFYLLARSYIQRRA